MIEKKEKKYTFIHIPKTAGSYISSILNVELKEKGIPFRNNINEDGSKHHMLKNMITENTEIKFTLMRCPIKRLISSYFFSKNNKDKKYFEIVKQKFIKYNIQSFNDLINLLKKDVNAVYSISGGFAPQYIWITDDNKNLLVDKIYKLDNDKFFEDFNIDKNKYLEKKNISNYDEKINLTEDIKKLIINAYKFDYQLYNSI